MHSADEKDYGDVQNVPGPKAAEAERPWSQTWHGRTVCWFMQATLGCWHFQTPDAPRSLATTHPNV